MYVCVFEWRFSAFWQVHDYSGYRPTIMDYLVDFVTARETHVATHHVCLYSAGRIILKPESSSFFVWDSPVATL